MTRKEPHVINSRIRVQEREGDVFIERLHMMSDGNQRVLLMGTFRYSFTKDINDIIKELKHLHDNDK